MRKLTTSITILFKKYLPSPFTIAVLLTLLTMLLALVFMQPQPGENRLVAVLKHWERGIWNNGLLVFAYQMMLILVLGHVLVLSKPMDRLIISLTGYVKNTANAAVIVSVSTLLVSFFNWGLGLIFGAILARKVGEYAQEHTIAINYPLVGAAGYAGLMIWHGGMSGSAPLKVAETGHLQELMKNVSGDPALLHLPALIPTYETIFSWWNLLVFGALLLAVPLLLYVIGKKIPPAKIRLKVYQLDRIGSKVRKGVEKLDYSKLFALFFGLLILLTFAFQYSPSMARFNITPNMLNFFMLGAAIVLHGNFSNFLNAVEEAIKGTSGILIQFPLYFGIMGIMSGSGMITRWSDFFVSIANETTLPVFTFFSAALVNIFVPSGGGQWAVQGPVIVASALKLGVSLPKAVMALAYGDQVTNMLQPFWALPLLGITRLKAKEILPYTLLIMFVGIAIFITGLLLA